MNIEKKEKPRRFRRRPRGNRKYHSKKPGQSRGESSQNQNQPNRHGGHKPSRKFIVGIIPARMGSSRFPGKPLANIHGKAMIYHVYHRAQMSGLLEKVYVATPDQKIREYCLQNGMNVVLTSDSHERASDRAAEAMTKIEKKFNKKLDIVVMIQGDEPMITKEMIDLAVKPLLQDKKILVSNLVSPLKSEKEYQDANEVKVVANKHGFALYFSREPLPSTKKFKQTVTRLKQVSIMPFQRDFLLKFNSLPQTPLEKIESVDMLRCLEHGYPVKLVYGDFNTYSVDTKQDLSRVSKLMKHDPLMKTYSRKA